METSGRAICHLAYDYVFLSSSIQTSVDWREILVDSLYFRNIYSTYMYPFCLVMLYLAASTTCATLRHKVTVRKLQFIYLFVLTRRPVADASLNFGKTCSNGLRFLSSGFITFHPCLI